MQFTMKIKIALTAVAGLTLMSSCAVERPAETHQETRAGIGVAANKPQEAYDFFCRQRFPAGLQA